MRHLIPALVSTSLLSISLVAAAQQQEFSPIQKRVAQALNMEYRSEAELARDADRKPLEAVEVMGLEEGMTVVEFFPAGQAWYTKILAPTLGSEGELYLIDSQRTFDSWDNLLDNPVFDNAHKVVVEAGYNRQEGRYEIGGINLPVKDADLFLNIREYHNFNDEDKARLNKAAFDALKPGGRYVVIDHTRRHMQPETRVLGRREDPVQVILEVQEAGFELEKASDLFLNEKDGLDLEVGNEAVAGQTDRFFLVFQKPQ
jgi:predicted methyltransferase